MYLFELRFKVLVVLCSGSNARANALAARSTRPIADVASTAQRTESDTAAANLRPETTLTVESTFTAGSITADRAAGTTVRGRS